MKRTKIVFALTPLILFFCYGLKNNSPLSASDAVSQGYVKAKLSGKGHYSGNCVKLEVENLRQTALMLNLNSGDILNSEDDATQDLLVVHTQSIALRPGEKRSVSLEGFCCQAGNRAPKEGSGFIFGKRANEQLLKLCHFISNKKISDDLIQEAVWCISDNENPANIAVGSEEKDNTSATELRNFVCSLVGKENPWYSTPQNRIVNEERIIQSNPVEVFGSFKYKITVRTIIKAELRNEKNELLYTLPQSDPIPPGTFDYSFNLTVEGFPKGKYHVLLKSEREQIMDKEFSI